MEGEPVHEEEDQGLGIHTERISGLGFLCLGVGEILGMDAQRYHRQLRQHELADAQPVLQVIHLRLHQALDVVLHRRAGANHRIPGLHRGGDEVRQGIHRAGTAGGVRDAAQAPGTVPES